jgi:glycerophosphoryl diester phosphodiesterase
VTFGMLVLGHRGASATHPENSIEAFEAARAQGADGVELDVRRTADGAGVIRHDPTLPDGRALADLAAAEVPQWVPSLEAALDACSGMDCVNIEIKNWPDDTDFDPDDTLAEVVVATLAGRPDRDRALVSSFHLPTIERVHALAPDLATGWLRLNLADLHGDLDLVAGGGHRAVHPHAAFVDAALVDAAHDRGLLVVTWTVDDPDHLRRLEAMGVDVAITNDPATALAALGR